MTGEADLRTPMRQSEEFYRALKMLKKETLLCACRTNSRLPAVTQLLQQLYLQAVREAQAVGRRCLPGHSTQHAAAPHAESLLERERTAVSNPQPEYGAQRRGLAGQLQRIDDGHIRGNGQSPVGRKSVAPCSIARAARNASVDRGGCWPLTNSPRRIDQCGLQFQDRHCRSASATRRRVDCLLHRERAPEHLRMLMMRTKARTVTHARRTGIGPATQPRASASPPRAGRRRL